MVWEGNPPGVFESWSACKKAISGYSGAKYKSFTSKKEAQKAYDLDYYSYKQTQKKESAVTPKPYNPKNIPDLYSIAVDAASSGNPGKMEYRGVDTQTHKQLFKQGPFAEGTNNIGEFLAIVHGLAFLKKNNSARALYTDSKVAMGWVAKKKCNTKLLETPKNKALFSLILRAEHWLKTNSYQTKILKWDTATWGEIPADFGRKKK